MNAHVLWSGVELVAVASLVVLIPLFFALIHRRMSRPPEQVRRPMWLSADLKAKFKRKMSGSKPSEPDENND